MKVLIITRHFLDQNAGGPNASKAFITALIEIYKQCTLIYPEHNNKNSCNYIPVHVKALPCYDNRSLIKKGIDIYRGRLHRFMEFVKSHLQQNQYDLVVIDHSLTGAEIIDIVRKTKMKIITIHHNVESKYVKDNLPNCLYRIPYIYFSNKAEKDCLKYSDLNLTLTEIDTKYFIDKFNVNPSKIKNIGVFEMKNATTIPPVFSFKERSHNPILVISGSLNFPQSEKPIINFINHYYCLLLKKYPDCKLIITGRNPSKKLISICLKYPTIQLIPNPKSMSDVISLGNIYICPIYAGSGIKLRIMDGLRRGLPILSHEISANGYESIEKAGYLFKYNTPETFINSFSIMYNQNFEAEKIYETFINYFSYNSGKERIRKILFDAKLIN